MTGVLLHLWLQNLRQRTFAEIVLIASPAELRSIAAFLLSAADKMESMGASYGHEHLSDRQLGFEKSPHFVVFNSPNLG